MFYPEHYIQQSHLLVQTKQQKGYWGEGILTKCPPSHFSGGRRVKLVLTSYSAWLQCVGVWVDLCVLSRQWWKGPWWAGSPVSSTATCWKNWPEGAFLELHSPSNAQATSELIWRKVLTVLEKGMDEASIWKLETKKITTFHYVK